MISPDARHLLVLLPGTDGTGALFAPLCAALAPQMDTQVIAYPQTGDQAYEALGRWLLTELPRDRDYVLLGESFGGPLAIWLAAHAERKPLGLILAASFAASPFGGFGRVVIPLLVVAEYLPLWTWQIDLILFNGRRDLAEWAHDNVRPVARKTLIDRVRAVATCDVRNLLTGLDIPLLCLDAAHDRLIWPWLPRHHDAPSRQRVPLPLPHMMLQSDPEGIATSYIRPFVEDLFCPGLCAKALPCSNARKQKARRRPSSSPPSTTSFRFRSSKRCASHCWSVCFRSASRARC